MEKNKSRTLLDLLPPDDQKIALAKYEKRKAQKEAQSGALEIPYSWYVAGQMLVYGGWEAFMTIRRGYTINPDVTPDGKLIYRKNIFTLEEAMMTIDAARKVKNSQTVDIGWANMAATSAASQTSPKDAYLKGVDGLVNGIKVK